MDGVQIGGTHLRNDEMGPAEPPLPAARGPDKSKRDEWSEGGVLNLLEVYESKWLLRNRAKLKGSDWEDIAHEVSVRCSGTKAVKTPNQCKNKIESMKKRYRAESAATSNPNSCSSWQFYARMDELLKGTANYSSQVKCVNDNNLQVLPKLETDLDVERNLQDINHDDGSNTLPNDGINGNNVNDKKESRAMDSDVSTPRGKMANAGDGIGMASDPSKRRKSSGSDVAESIRLLAQSILKVEQVRMEMYKDTEKMRAEAEIKRGEMELKRTEIIANTQLQIAKLFSKRSHRTSSKSESSSLRAEPDILQRREGMAD